LIGSTVHEFLVTLLRGIPGAAAISLFCPLPVPTLQQRIRSSPLAEEIIQAATDLRARSNLPFWDAINVSSFGRRTVALDLLNEALFHNRAGSRTQKVPIAGLTAPVLAGLCQADATKITVLSSAIEMEDGSRQHLPMLDFHSPASEANLPLVTAAASQLHAHGFILKSGKSYHFYGGSLLSEAQNIDHLARALLLAPIVDRAWIAHQLIERACGLRISTREERHVPFVIAEF
jgi:hypothetical protein